MDLHPVYEYTDYKKFLNDQIDQNAAIRGYKSLLADAAGCQRSFMSQVLNGPVHITPEHAIGLAAFWKMDPEATEFFLELVNWGRAGTPALRTHIERRLRGIRTVQRDAAVKIQRPELADIEHQSIYYSHWYWTALHVLISIKDMRTEKALAQRLHIPMEMVTPALQLMEKMGLVKKDKTGWSPTGKSLHAPRNSIPSWLHHDSWRAKAAESIRKRSEESVHFTGVYSLSKTDKARIQDLVLNLMGRVEKIIIPSPEEDAACLCIDWFDV